MVNAFLEGRNRAAQPADAGFRPLSQATIRTALLEHEGEQLAGATLSNFLNGEANIGGNRNWYAFAPRILRLVLCGTSRERPPQDAAECADRICSFFFPEGFQPGDVSGDRSRTWFFHIRLRGLDAPATMAEEVSELRAIAYRCGRASARGRALVVHVSGDKPFPHVDHRGGLTDLGRETLNCLRAGVNVSLCYPRTTHGSDAQESAKQLADVTSRAPAGARVRIRLVALDPGTVQADAEGREHWAGEYLGRSLRYWYQRCEPATPKARWSGWSSMGVSRGGHWGPCAFQPDDAERDAFAGWVERFVTSPRADSRPLDTAADQSSSVAQPLN
jgi:hypothetical protein